MPMMETICKNEVCPLRAGIIKDAYKWAYNRAMALYNITTRDEFEEKVLKSSKLVLVDFWAQWCPPCRAMAPTLEAVAQDLDAKFDVVKIDTEASQDNASLAGEYRVQSIPNMQLFQGGKHVDTIIGLVPRSVLEAKLHTLLG